MLENEDDDDVSSFNEAMNSSPYSCDENGVSNLEKAIASDAQDRKELQEFMGQMSHPLFQQLATLPETERDAILAQVKATLDNPSPSNSEPQGDE